MSQYNFTTSLEKDNTTQNKKIKLKKILKKTKNKQTNKKHSTTIVVQKAAIILHELKSEPKKQLLLSFLF